MTAGELLRISNFKHFIFYGDKKLEKDIEYKNNVFEFSKIEWDHVKKLGYDDCFYNYSHAISMILAQGYKNASTIAYVIDKILKLKISYIEYDSTDETLYIYVK